MSSTKRGGKRSPADFYRTPGWCVSRLLEAVSFPSGRWLEPGCGEGDIVRVVRDSIPGVTVSGFDLRNTKFIRSETSNEFVVGNILKPQGQLAEWMAGPKFDMAIGNPPFRLAAQFIEFALKHANNVAMLLRLNYLASDERSAFMRTFCPDVFILPNRPSFRPSKRGLLTTDSIEYGWFVWRTSALPRAEGTVKVLATTPKEVRRAQA